MGSSDEGEESSLENDEAEEMMSLPSSENVGGGGGWTGRHGRPSGGSSRNVAGFTNVVGALNRNRNTNDNINVNSNDDDIVIGKSGSTNELILEYDIEDEVYDDAIVDIVFHHDLEAESHGTGVIRNSDSRNIQHDYGYGDDDHGDDDHGAMYDDYDHPIQSGECPHYEGVGVVGIGIGGSNFGHDEMGSVVSHVDSEGLDQFDDDQLINQFAMEDYGWRSPRQQDLSSSSETPVLVSGLNVVGDPDNSPGGDRYSMDAMGGGPADPVMVTTANLAPSAPSPNSAPVDQSRRPSFNQMRRISYASSNSDQSYHSEPNPTGRTASPLYGDGADGGLQLRELRRPLSISVPNAEGAGRARRNSNRSSLRRSSVQIKSFAAGALAGAGNRNSIVSTLSSSGDFSEDGTSMTPSSSHSKGSSVSLLPFRQRRSRQTRQSMSIQSRAGPLGSLNNAIDILSNQEGNSEWENVAAAVTVVAASEQGGSSKSRHISFAVNDTVLVFLTLLNVTNLEDPKDTFTIAPVNKYGYPAGEGRTDDEGKSPYTFVLCTVKHVHFDEDDRYYTVERADTGTEQRADSGWMEPLKDPFGIEAASRAAKRTVRSTQDKPDEGLDEAGIFHACMDMAIDILSWPHDFFVSILLPFYKRLRGALKRLVTQLLYGDAPFSCKLRITGINMLVLCSMAFLFLEVITLGFLPADVDDQVAICVT